MTGCMFQFRSVDALLLFIYGLQWSISASESFDSEQQLQFSSASFWMAVMAAKRSADLAVLLVRRSAFEANNVACR